MKPHTTTHSVDNLKNHFPNIALNWWVYIVYEFGDLVNSLSLAKKKFFKCCLWDEPREIVMCFNIIMTCEVSMILFDVTPGTSWQMLSVSVSSTSTLARAGTVQAILNGGSIYNKGQISKWITVITSYQLGKTS